MATVGIVLMLLSITPLSALHHLFNCHKPAAVKDTHTHTLTIAPQKFHCACQHFNYQTPYLYVSQAFAQLNVEHEASGADALKPICTLPFINAADLRGPPLHRLT